MMIKLAIEVLIYLDLQSTAREYTSLKKHKEKEDIGSQEY